MTQPLAEWLAEVKARLAEAATSLEAWNGACEMDEVGQTHLTLEAELTLSRRKERAEDAVRDSAITDLARAVEELEKPVAITEEMVERAGKAIHRIFHRRGWELDTWESSRKEYEELARAALEAALRPTP